MPDDPLDELAAALRRLHRDAGEPSTHKIGKQINYSHTTVAQALKGKRCPSWPVVEALVTHLKGDLVVFRSYWIAVRDVQDPLPPPSTSLLTDSEQSPRHVADTAFGSDREADALSDTRERPVLRWKTKLETVEFFDEGLALQWIKARMQAGDSHE